MTKGVYIGPFQRIVNVGWNVRNEIATLQWNSDFFSTSSRTFTASLSLPQLGFATDLFSTLPTVIAPPGIITPLLRGKSFWEYPTVKTNSIFDPSGGFFRRAFLFLNVSRIKRLLPRESAFRIIIETSDAVSATHDHLTWQATVTSWNNRVAFPVTPAPDYSPLYGFPISFDPPPFPDSSLTLVAGGEAVVPAATAEFDINLTSYAVTGSRVDH